MSEVREPYIKTLERQRDALVKALKAYEDWYAAETNLQNTGRKADALKIADSKQRDFNLALDDAKTALGGKYV